jgi:hypothetical protein
MGVEHQRHAGRGGGIGDPAQMSGVERHRGRLDRQIDVAAPVGEQAGDGNVGGDDLFRPRLAGLEIADRRGQPVAVERSAAPGRASRTRAGHDPLDISRQSVAGLPESGPGAGHQLLAGARRLRSEAIASAAKAIAPFALKG